MKVTYKVTRLYKFNGEGPVKGIADVAINDEFLVRGFRIIEGKDGLFVGMPKGIGKDGKRYDNAFPLSAKSKELLSQVLLDAYENN